MPIMGTQAGSAPAMSRSEGTDTAETFVRIFVAAEGGEQQSNATSPTQR
jgi:hypothetical protein